VTRGAARLLVAAAALCAGCSAAPLEKKAPLPDVVAPRIFEVRDVEGAWRADSRWRLRVAAVDAAVAATATSVRAKTGIEFEPGRGPLVEFDADAPVFGDVAMRFVGGIRRPVVRIQPRALLSGEFAPPTDVATLVARSAMSVGAGEREPSVLVARGVAVVVAEAFDLELHRRALAGPAPRVGAEELFGDAASDPLAAAVRAKALQRCARSERPFVRFLEAHFAGRSEDAALAEVGISRRELLDAATTTERARAVRSIADDPLLSALRTARAALDAGDVERADSALAAVAASPVGPGSDRWIAADVRLCQAQVAMARGEIRGARTALAAAAETADLVRVRDARLVETWLAVKRGDAAKAWPEFVRDFPAPTESAHRLEMLGVPAVSAAKHAWLVPDASSLDVAKRVAAARFVAASGAEELAPLLRMLAADAEETVRRAAAPAAPSRPK
jgi:hypothetical protein